MSEPAQQLVKPRKPAVRTVVVPKPPITLVRLLERLTELLGQEEVSDDDWEDAFAEALAQYHLAAYAHGAGMSIDQLTPEDHKLVQSVIDRQKEFLNNFRKAWAEGRYADRTEAAVHRADMYADATLGTWWMGRTRGYPLPAWPGDGTTQCKTRCRCAWDIQDLGGGNADAYWRLGAADHCQTCMQRSEDWSPLNIRDGELQLKSFTEKGWVTIHGHPVLIGAPGSGSGGGGGGSGAKKAPKRTLGESAGAAAPTAVESAQAKLDATNAAMTEARRLGQVDKLKELEAERVRNHGALYRARKAEKDAKPPAAKPVVQPPELKPVTPPPTPAIEAMKAKVTPLATPGVIRGSDHVQAKINELSAQKAAAKAKGDTNTVETLDAEIRYQRSRKAVLVKAERKEDEKAEVLAGGQSDAMKARIAREKLGVPPNVVAQRLNAELGGMASADPNSDPRVTKAQAKYRDMVQTYGAGSIFAGDAQNAVQKARQLAQADAAATQAKGRKVILDSLGPRPPAQVKVTYRGMEHLTPQQQAAVKEGTAFFQKMVGPGTKIDGAKVTVQIHAGPGRACFDGSKVHLYAHSTHELGEITVHELGHFLEKKDPKVVKQAVSFLNRRTAGEAPRRLSDIVHGSNYGPSEIATPDKFFNPYVGRRYAFTGTDATEVTSMALQEFYARPKQLLERDSDMFNTIWMSVTG